MNHAGSARAAHAYFEFFPAIRSIPGAQPCNLDGISMEFLCIQEENSAHYFRVQSEREQTLVTHSLLIMNKSPETTVFTRAPVIDFRYETKARKVMIDFKFDALYR